ncbi:unnamed protein product, partial [Rhizoctonia solani]
MFSSVKGEVSTAVHSHGRSDPSSPCFPAFVGTAPRPALQDFSDVVGNNAAYPLSCSDVITLLKRQSCLDLTAGIDSSKCPKLPLPIANRTVADLFSGPLQDGTPVAIKKLRTKYDQAKRARVYDKRVAREIHTWSKCDHHNVLKMEGVAKFHEHLAIISRWEANGNLLHYLSRRPSTDRCRLAKHVNLRRTCIPSWAQH